MKFDNQLRYGSTIIASYQGEIPLHAWLKNFFREHKQMGSKDRKLLSNMVYGFYRLGHAIKDLPVEERILIGLFLCNDSPHELLQYFRSDWNGHIARPLAEKITLLQESGIAFEPTDIFPWKDELSEGIDHEAFCLSFLRQPDLFLRIRPGYEKEVLRKLEQPARPIVYEFIPPSTLRLPNGFNVEEWFTPDREVVIQDYSSQRIAPFLQIGVALSAGISGRSHPSAPLSFWDACAASGGKSILAFDLNPLIDITVSDIRESILHNLRERFRQAGIKKYQAFVANLATSPTANRPSYDLILADAPCTGSGTWSRTPEDLYFFHPKKILHYSEQQKKIVANILRPPFQKRGESNDPDTKKETSFVYSTCSVFKKENEEIATFIRDSFGLQPDRMECIKGYDQKADSMFAARFLA
jgi:16S rRNA (cytosine967-C5)-methyltransferase